MAANHYASGNGGSGIRVTVKSEVAHIPEATNTERVPEQQERFATFCTFGRPDHHLERYISNMVARGDYHDYFLHAGMSPKILELARRRGITLRHPIPEYGSKYAFGEGVEAAAKGAGP